MAQIGDNCDAHIYFIGAICQDIILHVDDYPGEDEKIQTKSVEMRRGGNSGNSLEVLCQLIKTRIYFLGAFGGSIDSLLTKDLIESGISLEYSVFRPLTENSTSWIISTGKSRTVINYNPIIDMNLNEFIPCLSSLSSVSNWFHFEGRNVSETFKMITYLRGHTAHPIKISIEIEKGGRPNIESLIPLADVLFFSSSFARHKGCKTGQEFMNSDMDTRPGYDILSYNRALVFCSWGGDGAYGKDSSESYHAVVPSGIIPIDSVGAGDTWIACMIRNLSKQVPWKDALVSSTFIASQKTRVKGFKLDFLELVQNMSALSEYFGSKSLEVPFDSI